MTYFDKLPAQAAAVSPGTGEKVIIQRGESGCYPQREDFDVNAFNDRHGVTPAQVQAMLAGSMFGWDVPGANPDKYSHLNG